MLKTKIPPAEANTVAETAVTADRPTAMALVSPLGDGHGVDAGAEIVPPPGGAGYIGSHVERQLGEDGRHVVVLENLSKGFRETVLYGELVVGDTGDKNLVDKLLTDYLVESVSHFAAHL